MLQTQYDKLLLRVQALEKKVIVYTTIEILYRST